MPLPRAIAGPNISDGAYDFPGKAKKYLETDFIGHFLSIKRKIYLKILIK